MKFVSILLTVVMPSFVFAQQFFSISTVIYPDSSKSGEYIAVNSRIQFTDEGAERFGPLHVQSRAQLGADAAYVEIVRAQCNTKLPVKELRMDSSRIQSGSIEISLGCSKK